MCFSGKKYLCLDCLHCSDVNGHKSIFNLNTGKVHVVPDVFTQDGYSILYLSSDVKAACNYIQACNNELDELDMACADMMTCKSSPGPVCDVCSIQTFTVSPNMHSPFSDIPFLLLC